MKKRYRIVQLVVLSVLMTLLISGCSDRTVESWFLAKEYDPDIGFEDFKTAAESLDKDNYFVKTYVSGWGPRIYITTISGDKFSASVTQRVDTETAKDEYYKSVFSSGQTMISEGIVRVGDTLIEGDGSIVKLLLDRVGIKTHDSTFVPAENRIRMSKNLVPFERVREALEAKGYIFSVPTDNVLTEGVVYIICSPEGTEIYTVIDFEAQKTSDEAINIARDLTYSVKTRGLNIYYCNTYAVRCVGDQWIRLTEGISN